MGSEREWPRQGRRETHGRQQQSGICGIRVAAAGAPGPVCQRSNFGQRHTDTGAGLNRSLESPRFLLSLALRFPPDLPAPCVGVAGRSSRRSLRWFSPVRVCPCSPFVLATTTVVACSPTWNTHAQLTMHADAPAMDKHSRGDADTQAANTWIVLLRIRRVCGCGR